MAVAQVKPDTREAILDACDRLMGRYGFRKMSMDDLAREAQVAKRTIYLHFHSKEEVGLSSIGRVVETVRQNLVEIAAAPLPPPDRLHMMLVQRVIGRVMAVQDYHHSLDELFEVVRTSYMARRRRVFEEEATIIRNVLVEGRATGHFMFDDSASTAEALLLATNAFLPYSLSVRELGHPTEIEKRLLTMVELLIRGLVAR